MRLRTLLTVGLAASMAIAALGTPAVAKKRKPAGPVVVGTDPTGDWGANADPTTAPGGDALGQDLVEASFDMADKKTVDFIIKVNALPASGGVPEGSRYTWDFFVDAQAFQLSGAFTDYVRGLCNPLHTGECPPPKDPGMAPFFLRHGECTVGSDCFVDTIAHATFDAATGTITIPIPLEALGAKAGSKISPGATSFGGTIYAAPSALVSYASLPNDTMVVTKTYKIPRK